MSLIDGRFTPKHELGAGGFGQVYAAHDRVTNATVALKFLTKADAESRVRFAREARMQADFATNPHVVQAVHHNLDHVPPYIATEFCDLGSLRSWIGGARNWREVAAALAHIVGGLASVHDAGGFHRDIKPENLLIQTSPTEPDKVLIKLSDFGLARSGKSSDFTQHGAGTPGYVAPEVMKGGAFTPAADVFSIGVVACELLTGGKDGTELKRVLMPEEMRELVLGMLATSADLRPTVPTIAQVLHGLLVSSDAHGTTVPEREGGQLDKPRGGFDPDMGDLLLGALLVAGVIALIYLIATSVKKGVSAGPPAAA